MALGAIQTIAIVIAAYITIWFLATTIGGFTIPVIIILFVIAYFYLKKKTPAKKENKSSKKGKDG